MKIITLLFLLTLQIKLINSATIKMEAYGSNKSKIFKVTDKRTFMHTSAKGIVTYQPNVRAVFDCAGILEIKDGKTTSNTMCKVTEDNGDIHYAQFNAKERFISTFTYISGEGRWKEMIGKKCIGASSIMLPKEIEENLVESQFMWAGKCELPEENLNRFINYKKPE